MTSDIESSTTLAGWNALTKPTIQSTKAGGTGKLFGRLKGVKP